MINCNNQNNNISFHGRFGVTKMLIPAFGLFCCTSLASPTGDEFIKSSDKQEQVADSVKFFSALNEAELLDVPSPVITIAGKEEKAGIVVDTETNKLFRYDSDGNVVDGYYVATGVKKNGKCITGKGIRVVTRIEDYPYAKAYGSKRKRNPENYGPNVLYLEIIDAKTGRNLGSNGEFIHGNNDEESVRKHKYASGGCIRTENGVIKKFAAEVKKGTLVLIK